jgi:hypothetical protein
MKLFIDKIVVWMSKVLCLFIGIFHKILSISVISIICASNVCVQGTEGNLGTPELYISPKDAQEINQAVIIRIDVDGTETIVGYTLRNVDAGTNHFILKE